MTEEEIKLAIEDSTIGNGEKVICLNTEEIFKSAREAEREYNIDGVSDCCRKEQNYCGKLEDGTKLVWRKYEDYINMTEEEIENVINFDIIYNTTSVVCLNTREIFENTKEADEKYNCHGCINKCCNKKRKTVGKLANGTPLVWRYYEDYINMTEEEIEKIIKDSTINNGKKVICLDTLEIFESRASACKKYNIDSKSLRECCNGKRKSAKGLHWMNYEDYLELQIS